MDKGQTILDFTVIRKLGQGSFGEVLLAERGSQQVAIKKISKKQIIKVNKLHEPFVEKEILLRLNQHCGNEPLFVAIEQTESDDDYVYLILEYCSGGTLENLIFNESLSGEDICHLAAKMILTLEKLHCLEVIHRDLKPSNFLLTSDGFLKLSDFGTAYAPDSFFGPQVAQRIKAIRGMNQVKEEKEQKDAEGAEKIEQRRSTFVGTACYMAPELLAEDICEKEADIWAFGCILYEMIFKKSPFFDISEGMVWKKILNDEIDYTLPSSDSRLQDAIGLIRGILVKDIDKRLGSGAEGYKALKGHLFFKGIDWQKEALAPMEIIKSLSIKKVPASGMSKKGDKVLLSGVVKKKMFFGNFSERMLILYSTPKLVYYQTDNGEKKGEIMLERDTPLCVEGKVFTITNEKKTYYFKSKTTPEWVEMIKSAIVNAYY